ncbi:Leucine-rich repeat 3 protein [Raphanus sativus]|nr:Leucine-rich repeat 3 protein [Raphanus sativus]
MHGFSLEVEGCFWNNNLCGLDYLGCIMRCIPCKFRPEHLIGLTVKSNMLEKLWEGVQMDEDHLLMFHFGFPLEEVNHTSSELDYIHVEFEYCYHKGACSYTYGSHSHWQSCLLSVKMIKGCGLRLLNLSESPYGAARIPETKYDQKSGESDRESGRSNKRTRVTFDYFSGSTRE